MNNYNFFSLKIHLVFLTIFSLILVLPGLVRADIIDFTPSDGMEKIGKTISRVQPGSEIRLLPGIYRGTLRIARAKGISTHPVMVVGTKGTIIDAWNVARQDRGGYGEHGILIQNSSHVILKGIEIQGAERGITIGNAMDISILGCHIHDVRNYGIMNYKSAGTRMAGNRISRSLKEHGIYISGQAQDIQIRENIIADSHINGIHCNGRITSSIIERNQFYRIGTYPSKEGGAAVTMVNGASDALIQNNLFVDIYGQGFTVSGAGVKIINNVFHNVAWSVILGIQGVSNLEFINNIVIEGKAVPFQIHGGGLVSFACDYNYYCLKNQPFYESHGEKMNWRQWRNKGFDSHSVQGKMPFTTTTNIPKELLFDYLPAPDSIAVDGGMPELKDGRIPPGLGGIRSDLGIFGGPGNGWSIL